jgi:hypothetical protein
MFCPQCGSTQSDDLKYCKTCGANLQALRSVMATRDSGEGLDWSKTWVAEMFMTNAEKDKRRGITAADKRRREIKAGVITAASGVAIAIFLFALMGGIIASGRASDAASEILSRIWIVGVIPILVGAALIFNGVFLSEKTDALPAANTDREGETGELSPSSASFLSPASTNELEAGTPFSVTDATTRHLHEVPRRKDS